MHAPPYLQKLKKAASKNLVPGLILQLFALALILTYYNVPFFKSFWNNIGTLKQKYGYLFSFISTALFGAVIPYIVITFTRSFRKKYYFRDFLVLLLFWAVKGIEVDFLYRRLGILLGSEPGFRVVALKVLMDQFIYAPFWAVPTMSLFYLWKDSEFSISRMKRSLNKKHFQEKVIPLFFSNMTVWVPAVTIIYCFPLNLQLILSNLVLCFWSLILNILLVEKNSIEAERGN